MEFADALTDGKKPPGRHSGMGIILTPVNTGRLASGVFLNGSVRAGEWAYSLWQS